MGREWERPTRYRTSGLWKTSPQPVSTLTGVTAIAAGQGSLALKNDGTVWAWGTNLNGELGQGTHDNTAHTTPTQVPSVSGVLTITAGSAYNFAVAGDGSVWSWGNNTWGQLGDGTTTERDSPVLIGSLPYGIALAGGGSFTLAVALSLDSLHACSCSTTWTANTADPVNTVFGQYLEQQTDLRIPGRGPAIDITRTYRSADPTDVGFGIGWSVPFAMRLLAPTPSTVIVRNPDGRRDQYTLSGGSYLPPAGFHNQLVKNLDGSYTLTTPSQLVYAFTAAGQLNGISDPNGNQTSFSWSTSGLTISDAGGRQVTLSYGTGSQANHFVSLSDPLGRGVSYSYDSLHHLTSVTDVRSGVTSYTYDQVGRLLTMTDPLNRQVVKNNYDRAGRVIQQFDGRGNATSFSYDPLNRQTTVTDPLNHATVYHYDSSWRITSITDALNHTVSYQYDANNNRTQVTDPRGTVTTYTYDAHGNVLSQTVDPSGLDLVSSFSYDSLNDLLTATDPLNHTTTNTYDAHGNLLTVSNALNQTTTLTYDGHGQLSTVTDANNHTVTYGYDSYGNRTSITDALNKVTTQTFDLGGRLTSVSDPNNHTTSFSYNAANLLTSVTDPLSHVTSYGYDLAGNRTSVTDALNRTTSSAYDGDNHLISVTDALNHTTTFAYDDANNLASVTDANNHTTSYSYDAANRLATMQDALTHTTTYTKDADGNTTLIQQPNGNSNAYVYDRANRLTGVDLGNDSTLDIQYGYDDASRRTSMIDATGTTSYGYDNANRLTSVTAPTTGTVSYGYDNAGQETSLTYASTHQVSYSYTDRGQLASVTDWLSQTTSYGYDDAGRLTSASFPNGVSGTLGYDDANRLTGISYSLSGTSLLGISYGLNAVGDRTSLVDGSGTTTYDYDNLDRLTSANYPNGDAVSYGYDPVGNRTSLTVNGTLTTNTFNAANQLTASGSDSYSYDLNGNLSSQTVGGVTTTYGYDQLNRLTSISGPTTASYAYNGDGLRVAKTVNGTTTNYSWDPTGIGHVLSDGNEYVWGVGLIGQVRNTGSATYAQSDGLGSIRLLTDGSGTVVGTQQYDAFGETRNQSGVQLPYSFAGEQMDSESSLGYLRARYYAPAEGRFVTQDPLGFSGSGVNLYAYVMNDPVNDTDPSGEFSPRQLMQQARSTLTSPQFRVVADTVAVYFSGEAAATTDVSAVLGCLTFGAPGCLAGYTVGRGLSLELSFIATVAAITSGISSCLDAGKQVLNGAANKASSFLACAQSYALWAMGENLTDPNLAFVLNLATLLSDYSACVDEGK